MPPPYVKTIRGEILYEYAKLISRTVYGSLERGFITDRFNKLCDGEITMSGTIREWEREQELQKMCVYCGSVEGLTTDHLIPTSRGGEDSAENAVVACKSCNASKGERGIFEWLGLEEKDKLHRLVAGKYLKQLFELHERTGTLDISKYSIGTLCNTCPIPDVCSQWGRTEKLTCFCLESILPKHRDGVAGKPAESVLSLIGRTPMVKLQNISRNLPAKIWAKLEYYNPSGSVKDRIALYMIEEAERRGEIRKGSTIVEPTSGNTGIGLALVCALKGYKMVAVMPEAMSSERRMVMELLGAKVDIVPCADKSKGFIKDDIVNTMERAKELVRNIPNAFMPNQFDNVDNPNVHEKTTAKEIIRQTNGRFDAFVAACGTGGTFSGVAKVLKRDYPHILKVVVEPAGSPVLSGREPGYHKIQGIGEGFIPGVMDTSLADEVVQVSDEDAIAMMKRLAKEEGILSGISGGANVSASLQVGKKMKKGSIIVTIIPDHAFRYLSTSIL